MPVQPVQQGKGRLLLFAVHALGRCGVGQGIGGVDVQPHPVVLRSEVVGAVCFLASAAIGQRGAHDHELGQVLIQRAQAVVHPGPDGGEEAVHPVAPGVKGELRPVIAVLGPHRANHRELVCVFRHVGKPVADLQPALPMPLVADLQGVDGLAQVTVNRVEGHHPLVGQEG